jgi:hypothetical protein
LISPSSLNDLSKTKKCIKNSQLLLFCQIFFASLKTLIGYTYSILFGTSRFMGVFVHCGFFHQNEIIILVHLLPLGIDFYFEAFDSTCGSFLLVMLDISLSEFFLISFIHIKQINACNVWVISPPFPPLPLPPPFPSPPPSPSYPLATRQNIQLPSSQSQCTF